MTNLNNINTPKSPSLWSRNSRIRGWWDKFPPKSNQELDNWKRKGDDYKRRRIATERGIQKKDLKKNKREKVRNSLYLENTLFSYINIWFSCFLSSTILLIFQLWISVSNVLKISCVDQELPSKFTFWCFWCPHYLTI